ncbi:hypothetical protein OF83DRAFT_1082211 [Amylostereum chailletii]|nr:hypothetical protein OF83DRAFT_1082211 [Amylostereum chailletii]
MFIKSIVSSFFLAAFATSAHAHAGVTPALGVAGTMVRSDVQRPNKLNACGKTDIASNIDTSTPIAANADGTFNATITNFNRFLDGSRQIKTVQIDPTGTGESFVKGQMLENGERAPSALGGSDALKVQMPAGMTCTGGASGSLCLAQLTTLSGFGNCVVVSQGASGNATDSGTDASVDDGTTSGNDTTTGTDASGDDSTTSGDDTVTGSGDNTASTAGASNNTSTVGTDSASVAGAAGAVATTVATSNDAAGSVESAVGSLAAKAGRLARAARAAKAA